MSTHERELTSDVLLCTPDGRRLNPEAVGWSRRPMHTANLRGSWGRNKRWDYWAVLTDDLVIAITYADMDYLGIAGVWWADLATGLTGGREVALPLARGIRLPARPGTEPLCFRGRRLRIELSDRPDTTRLRASWTEADGARGELDVEVAQPPNLESVNVVIPWSQRRFQYTSKQQARPATGTLTVGDRRWEIGAGAPAWGVLDVGRGRWPYRTVWNWGGGAGRSVDGRVIGLQFGGRWTQGTGATENGIIVEGTVTKLGDEVAWTYDWNAPMSPWRVRSPDGRLDVALTPRHDLHGRIELGALGRHVHQVFGRWAGTVPTADGGTVLLAEDVVGFAEESRARW